MPWSTDPPVLAGWYFHRQVDMEPHIVAVPAGGFSPGATIAEGKLYHVGPVGEWLGPIRPAIVNSFDALVAACNAARELYDQLAYGPLDGAAHFGPDWSPPNDADMLAVRGKLESALKLAGESQ